jgi:hypothetical protein
VDPSVRVPLFHFGGSPVELPSPLRPQLRLVLLVGLASSVFTMRMRSCIGSGVRRRGCDLAPRQSEFTQYVFDVTIDNAGFNWLAIHQGKTLGSAVVSHGRASVQPVYLAKY